MVEQLVIIGSGPAGYTAAIYGGRAQLNPLVFEGFSAGGVPGGQLMTTTEVENFPAFPDGISGQQLMGNMRKQALRWGAKLITDDVVQVDFHSYPFRVATEEMTVYTQAVIICTGATAKRLGIPGEDLFWNYGISACAVCDGANPLFQNAEVAVVGGGDTAAEEALYLTKYARQVHLLVRSHRLRASQIMRHRLDTHPQIQIHWHKKILSAGGKESLESVQLQDSVTGELSSLSVSGLFYAIGHQPNTHIFQGQLPLNAQGYIQTIGKTLATGIPGVWAAGDVQDAHYRQAITAAGTGCMAALEAERWLAHQQARLSLQAA